MREDYSALKGLENSRGYQILMELWIYQMSKIEEARDKAAKQSTHKAESDWRYMAGQEKGFKLAMTALQRGIVDMEKKMSEELDKSTTDFDIDKLLSEVRKP